MGMRHHALFYALRFIRPYGTIVWFFPVSQEFLLGYSQTVPTGLSFGFSRVPGVPPGLQSNRPYGTTVWFFPVSQEFLLGYGQTVPAGLPFGFSPCLRSSSWATVKPSLRD